MFLAGAQWMLDPIYSMVYETCTAELKHFIADQVQSGAEDSQPDMSGSIRTCRAYGDGHLIDMHPELCYRCAPNAVECVVVLAVASLLRCCSLSCTTSNTLWDPTRVFHLRMCR